MSNGKKASNRDTSEASDLEPIIRAIASEEEFGGTFSKAVYVSFHSVRKRLADCDNLSGKAVLDGVVEAGVLRDDSPKYVKEVRHSQEQGAVEKTIITIYEVDDEAPD